MLIRTRARLRRVDKVSLTGKGRSAIELEIGTHDVVVLLQVITALEVKVSSNFSLLTYLLFLNTFR